MSRRDEPAFPVTEGADHCGLTCFEHTVIEMAKVALANEEASRRAKEHDGWSTDVWSGMYEAVATEAFSVAGVIWDTLDAAAEPDPPVEEPTPSETCEKCKKEGLCDEHIPF